MTSSGPSDTPHPRRPVAVGLAALVAALGALALMAPLGAAEQPLQRVGGLLAVVGFVEILHGLRRAEPSALRRSFMSGVVTMMMAFLVAGAPYVAATALLLFLAGWFAVDAIGYAMAAFRQAARRSRLFNGLAALGNFAVAVVLLALRGRQAVWMVTGACALRMFGVAWEIALAPVFAADSVSDTVTDDLGLADHPEAVALTAQVVADEQARAGADRGWTVAFVVTLFAIHVARMGSDGTLLGLVAPGVAVAGDMLIAILVSLLVAVPATLSWRKSTRWIERRVWLWYLRPGRHRDGWLGRMAAAWLRFRLRIDVRLREARYSIPLALRRCLARGLPFAAVLAATVPVWGMSWYFDTENWAAGMWNSWAEARTDVWRVAMVRAVTNGRSLADPATFALTAPGTAGDFAFIVIGDTGEGDASQHVLRDQLLSVAAQDQVKFVVISSDVIYPVGAMKDYEAKFWLPFKGVTKPVYAIPGNHDWYDALEAFLATFLEPDAARASMRARAEVDLRLTTTTSTRIEWLIKEAARLRGLYRVPTGFQRGPFFEIQTDRFALVAIDTGIVKRIDDDQWAWLEGALDRAKGKFTMAVVGHPFFAGGEDMTADNEDFAKLKALLVGRGVRVMMAGDTHDFEYYADPPPAGQPDLHYFVNGGGGAYMSFGTALSWPAKPPTTSWAFYPTHDQVAGKIEAMTPWFKRPAWWWTKGFGAWPFSAEWLSAAFDYNVAPFFQSFVEVVVEPSAGRVRFLPYGIYGRLRWSDITSSPNRRPAGGDEFVEWNVALQ